MHCIDRDFADFAFLYFSTTDWSIPDQDFEKFIIYNNEQLYQHQVITKYFRVF